MTYCISCGRPIEHLKKLEKNPEMKYCSPICRQHKWQKVDRDLESSIISMLEKNPSLKILPLTISKAFFGDHWKTHHHRVLKAARRLAAQNKVSLYKDHRKVIDTNVKEPFYVVIPILLNNYGIFGGHFFED